MSKPKQRNCIRYCKHYPCDRLNCDYKKLIVDDKFIMKPKSICDYWDIIRKRDRYRETGTTKVNGIHF